MDGMYADFAVAKICPCPNSAAGIVCEPLSVQVPVGIMCDRWILQPNKIFVSNGAQERVDKNSLWAVLTPAGLRRFAPCPNSAVGIVCEPLVGSSPG
jgi:hypothetical protein